jgi:hypothetical protein
MKTSKDILDYLKHLQFIKNENEPPFKVKKIEKLYNIYDKNGVLFFTCSAQILKIFEEL